MNELIFRVSKQKCELVKHNVVVTVSSMTMLFYYLAPLQNDITMRAVHFWGQ